MQQMMWKPALTLEGASHRTIQYKNSRILQCCRKELPALSLTSGRSSVQRQTPFGFRVCCKVKAQPWETEQIYIIPRIPSPVASHCVFAQTVFTTWNTFPFIYKAACQNHSTLQSPNQMPPPKVTASYRVRASGAHRDPPDTVLTLQKSSLLPPHHNTMTAANSRDSAKLSAGAMTQIQSSVLSPDSNTSWLWSQECQVCRTEPLCFWNGAFIFPCTVFVWI